MHAGISRRIVAGLGALAIVAGACGDSDDEGGADAQGDTEEATDEDAEVQVDLASVCPERIVVQTGWFAEATRGHLYHIVGPNGDSSQKGAYVGPIPQDPRVELEVRSGGPYIGFEPREVVAYQDLDIMLYEVATSEQLVGAAEFPSVAVVAPLERDPQVLIWDPEVYDFESLEDIRDSGAVVHVFEGIATWQYLMSAGLLDPDQVDTGYTGATDRFIAEGDIVEQSFATDVWRLENELEEWGRPVDSLLIADASDFEQYVLQLAVRPEVLEEEADCLERLVPIIQEAVVDYHADPEETNATITRILVEWDDFWQFSEEHGAFAVDTMLDNDLVGNGGDSTVGDFDVDRVQEQIGLIVPVIEEGGVEVPEDISAEDIVTNEFIDEDIGF